jgi:hypothetical protein
VPTPDVANPFINIALRVAKRELPLVEKFTATQQAQVDPDRVPFRRYVDLWWAGLCIGVVEGHRVDGLKADDWHRFADGSVLSSDPWRIVHLQLLAVALTGNVDILDEPGDVIQMANEYAATGLPLLLDEMNRSPEPIMVASEYLRQRCIEAKDRATY